MTTESGRGGFWWLGGGVAALFAYVFLSRSMGEGFAIPVGILLVLGATAAAALRGPIGRAISRRLEGETPLASDDVIAELEDLRARMLELEERVDFSERLLAGQRHDTAFPEADR